MRNSQPAAASASQSWSSRPYRATPHRLSSRSPLGNSSCALLAAIGKNRRDLLEGTRDSSKADEVCRLKKSSTSA